VCVFKRTRIHPSVRCFAFTRIFCVLVNFNLFFPFKSALLSGGHFYYGFDFKKKSLFLFFHAKIKNFLVISFVFVKRLKLNINSSK
jgi:hypothetical protein